MSALGRITQESDIHSTPYVIYCIYAFKGQAHMFAGRVKIVSHSSCRTSAILKYFAPCLLWKGLLVLLDRNIYEPVNEILVLIAL